MRQDRRALVLTQLIAGKVDVGEAALMWGRSSRSIRRRRRGSSLGGPEALVHGNGRRQPMHALAPPSPRASVTLARTTYAGCNESCLCELLAEHEAMTLSRASVQRLLRAARQPSPRKRRAPGCRARRERRAAAGMLVQVDGSRHR